LPYVAEDAPPFELPESWEWTKLGAIGYTQTGTTPSTTKSEYFGKGYPFIKPADITDKGINYDGDELTKAGIAVGRLVPNESALMVCIEAANKHYHPFCSNRCPLCCLLDEISTDTAASVVVGSTNYIAHIE